MPQFYRVLAADKIGDPYTPQKPGAAPIQSFWCQVEGVDEPVMINKQVPNVPSLTEGHYGVLEQRTSKKGNPYWKFTSMQIPQGSSKPRYDEGSAPVPSREDPEGEPYWFKPYRDRLDNLEKLLATPAEELNADVDEDKLKEIFGENIEIQDVPPKEG